MDVFDDHENRLAPRQAGDMFDQSLKRAPALVRGDAPYATGTVINVDGGLSIPRL